MIFTTDKPKREEERILVLFSVGFIAISRGRETNFSTSSALRPGHCVMMVILVLVTSGNASIVVFLKLKYPVSTKMKVAKKMKYLFFREKFMIDLMNLFITV
ncbi:hypothetical protein D3C87_1472950 [compost metagenome]